MSDKYTVFADEGICSSVMMSVSSENVLLTLCWVRERDSFAPC